MRQKVVWFSLIWIGFLLLYAVLWQWFPSTYFTIEGWIQVFLAGAIVFLFLLIGTKRRQGVKSYLTLMMVRMGISLVYLIALGLWLKKNAIVPLLTFAFSYFFLILAEGVLHYLLALKPSSGSAKRDVQES